MVQDIINICSESAAILTRVANDKELKAESFEFECRELKEMDWLGNDITKVGRYVDLFSKLVKVEGPVVYWIEITSPASNPDIISAVTKYKNSPDRSRAVSAFSKLNKHKENSRILYVGKVKKDFWGRVIQHFGYYKTPATGALQLVHWTDGLDLRFTYHYIKFKPEMADLVPIIEYGLAKKLNPIIGKHK